MSVEFFPIADRFRAIEVVENGDRVNINVTYRHVERAVSMSMRRVTEAERGQVHAVASGFFNRERPVYQQSWYGGSRHTFRRGPHRGEQVISERGEIVATAEMERRVEASAPPVGYPA